MKKHQNVDDEPIAIVGIAFRFPGDISDEQGFWEVLKGGLDAVSHIGSERFATHELQHAKRSEPGRSITFSAGVLSRIEEFDASFFGISPREALWMDPQQRLLLELAWEAMENGGQVPSQLAGSNCAVYVGISGLDYGVRGISDLASISSHSMTGNTLSIAANRLSYIFDLHGPSMSVDTACSSSLVALHQACNALRRGEAPVAMVGSVNLLLHPYPFVGFTKASMISARGRCRAFDAGADGYVRAEGGAVLMLKPLSKAGADGDPIHAVILGTGVNADGSRKSGLTIPSSKGQAELMRSVLKKSGISADDVAYIEAHGTGTPVGDPIEASAIGEVYGRGRATPLPIGSVKTNLGHLEATSGMAGLIKTVLMLRHRALPPSLHFEAPNPHIDFTGLNLQVVTGFMPLPASEKNLPIMGINSFGFGGSNAHALLQAYAPAKKPDRAQSKAALPRPPLFISARTPEALRAQAASYAEFLSAPAAPDYYDIAYNTAFRRQHLEHRLAVTSSDPAAALRAYAKGETPAEIMQEKALEDAATIAFIYSGNGAQWAGMGKRLLAESPRFADIIAGLDAAMVEPAGFSVLEILREGNTSALEDTAIAQPLLFAMQVAVTMLLRERGIEANAVAGHSAGEVAAAWAAGALTLDQAIEVICVRSAAQARTRGAGRMAAVGLSQDVMRALLQENAYHTIAIAGVNSPSNITLAGSLAELEALRQTLKARNVFFRLLDLDYAFHSLAMDPIMDRVCQQLADLAPAPTQIDFISTVTGARQDGTSLTASYWWDNVRDPVLFAKAMDELIARGCRVFVEIGPHAILQRYMTECLAAATCDGRVLPTLRKNEDGDAQLENVMLRLALLCGGETISAYFPVVVAFLRLPNYAWQRERYWLHQSSESYGLTERRRVHPLLGWRLKETESSWENVIDPRHDVYLADHVVAGAIVYPAAGYVEMALAAAREWFGGEQFELEELDILSPLVFDGEHARSTRFAFFPREGTFQIHSRQRLSEDAWSLNAVGRLLGASTQKPSEASLPAMQGRAISKDEHYHLAHLLGLDYGPAFQGFTQGNYAGDWLEGELASPESAAGYMLHPALLDVCFQSLVDFFREEVLAGHGLPLLPVKIGSLRYFSAAQPTRFHAHLTRRSARSVRAEFTLLDAQGAVVCHLTNCRFRAASVQRKAHEPAQWHMVARLLPHPVEADVIPTPALAAIAAQASEALRAGSGFSLRQRYSQEGASLYQALVISFAYAAFATHSALLQQALSRPETLPAPRRAYIRWLALCLVEAQLLKQDAGTWQLDPTQVPPPPETIWRMLLAEFPDALAELLFIGRIGRALPQLLDGTRSMQELSTALKASHLLDPVLHEALPYQGANKALQQVLRQLATNWPQNRRLRILEISAGASELSHQLAAQLPAGRTDYVIAELQGERHDRLTAEYHAHAFVTVATLDPHELTLLADAAIPNRFDIIILHHWLHSVASPGHALAAMRRRLTSGGTLILAERPASLAADFIYGLDAHWWCDSTSEKQSSLRDAASWTALLARQGFDHCEAVSDPADNETATAAYLLLARNNALPEKRELPPSAHWLLLCDAQGISHEFAERLASQLESQGQRVTLAQPGAASQHTDHLVYLAGVGAHKEGRCTQVLSLVQAMARGEFGRAKLWLLTSGGALLSQSQQDRIINPLEAALWGLGRVIMNEYPAFATKLIDLAFDPALPQAATRLLQELLWPDGEDEILLSVQARFGIRMQPLSAKPPASEPRFRLDFHVPGQLRNLLWLSEPERALLAGEIEVRPAAAGLNFRDVMYAMGLLPDEAVENGFSGASLGLEFAGVVSRVGKGVTEFAAGDEVMGFGPACLASHVVTKLGAVTRKPASWSFEQAVTVPATFFTAYYALKHLAQLQPGEKVLIHGAAGGVGIAAMQVARYLGAEIFATAGSDEKRDFVYLLGADHVLDSRSLAFADEILALTGGVGVDVVLNSLAGEAINRNLRALRPFGRFLELGKRDFFENTHIGLRPFKDNISYFGIDVDQLLSARPQLATQLFRDMMGLFEAGEFFPLPYRSFSAERVIEAFRHMQQSRHIGKLVVNLAHAQPVILAKAASLPPLRRNGTYMVTGGLSGLGLESARWLVEQGADHLVLISRRGFATPEARSAVASLEALGANVHVYACDVADKAALQKVFTTLATELPPLRGIIHAAMVIDDGLLANIDAQRFEQVFAPKARGAWNLHELTRELPLDYFILYSSITTSIGNPGQGNYVAANSYLEGLAAWRNQQGLPATCIGWGPIGDAGYLTHKTAVKESLTARLGAKPLEVRQVMAKLASLLAENVMEVTVADFDLASLARLLPSISGPRFDYLRGSATDREADAESPDSLAQIIAGKSAQEVQRIVQGLIVSEVAKILCIDAARIAPASSLADLGMDSLMTVELMLAIEQRFAVSLPAMSLSEGSGSVERIAAKIAEKLINAGQMPQSDTLEALVTSIAAQHAETLTPEEMSDMVEDVKRQTEDQGERLIA